MIPELGHFSLILGLAFALLLASVPLYGSARKDQYLVRYAWPLTYGMFFFISLSVIALGYSFAVDDFSVAYVANNSNSLLPVSHIILILNFQYSLKLRQCGAGMKGHYYSGYLRCLYGPHR